MVSRSQRAFAGALACAAALVLLLGAAYWWAPFQAADAAALRGFAGVERLDGICGLAIHLGDPVPMLVLLAAICAAGLAWGRRRQVLAAIALVAGANLMTQVLKLALAHPRLHHLLGPDQPSPTAFPSGHATAAMSIALAAVLVAPRRWRPYAALAGGVLSLSVSFSVLVLGWHFPSDALGGCLVATGFGLLALAALRAGEGVRDRRPLPRPQLAGLRVALPLEALVLLGLISSAVLALAHLPGALAYAHAHTSSVAAGLGIVVASAALLGAVAVEAGRR